MKYLLIAFVCLFVYKLANNILFLTRTNRYQKKHLEYLQGHCQNFPEYAHLIRSVFQSAGVDDAKFTVWESSGLGVVRATTASLFKNVTIKGEPFATETQKAFAESRGVFKHRIVEMLSPLYWLNYVLYLPKNILVHLGVDPKQLAMRIIQIMYWIFTPLLLIFRDRICAYIAELLLQFQQIP